MPAGYWFMLFGLLSFAAMGIIHKLGDSVQPCDQRQRCSFRNGIADAAARCEDAAGRRHLPVTGENVRCLWRLGSRGEHPPMRKARGNSISIVADAIGR